MSESYPPDYSIEDIKVRIQQTSGNPNIGNTQQVVLKDGPRTFRIATIFEIMDPAAGKLHHLSLQLDSFDKTKAAWKVKPEKRIRLDGESPDEISMLASFLQTALSKQYPEKAGDYHVVPDEQYKLLENLVNTIPNLPGQQKFELITELFKSFSDLDIEAQNFVAAFKNLTPIAAKHIGIAARYVEYESAFSEFSIFVDSSEAKESRLQSCLKTNPWIFGSEYSEILDRRKWTRDDSLDFMLRRTVDGYLEIIEIKTPAVEDLFRYDSSHDSYYPSSELSKALGQVFRYIEEVERKRDSIIASDNIDPLKIRARIIIGRDGNEKQQMALRTLNAHLHRVEVLTFDQLKRVGERTLGIFRSEFSNEMNRIQEQNIDDDLPF
jgi:hypothetical protein